MGICWFCYWGWPKQIAEIYRRAERDIDAIFEATEANDWAPSQLQPWYGERALKWGPAHTVWEDENFENVEWNLNYCDDPQFADWHPEALEIVRRSLRELEALPSELKQPPWNYDDKNPEDFPPPQGIEMVRIR